MHVEEGDIRDGNSKQKTEIPASGAPVGRAAHARLITILFDSSPPPQPLPFLRLRQSLFHRASLAGNR
jgi:hypothetical protein